MDWLTFASNALESLAWPIAAVALVALLRSEIAKLAPHLKKLKAGPVEAEFEREIKELKASTSGQERPDDAKQSDPASKSFLYQLAALHPRSAILETWVRVEAAARTVLAAKLAGASMSTYVPAARLAEALVPHGVLNQAQLTLFHELRRLRNEVAHAQGFEPTEESACAYIDLGVFLQGLLEGQVR